MPQRQRSNAALGRWKCCWKCPLHEEMIEKYWFTLLQDYKRLVRSISLDSAGKFDQPYKSAFITAILQIVMSVKKSRPRGNFLLLSTSYSIWELTRIWTHCGSPNEFFYACFQLTLRGTMITPKVKVQKDDLANVFLSYNKDSAEHQWVWQAVGIPLFWQVWQPILPNTCQFYCESFWSPSYKMVET